METNKNNLTKFETVLASMSLEDKHEVFTALVKVNDLFKEQVEESGEKWLDFMCGDEPLRNIFICSSIAAQMWLKDYRKNNQ